MRATAASGFAHTVPSQMSTHAPRPWYAEVSRGTAPPAGTASASATMTTEALTTWLPDRFLFDPEPAATFVVGEAVHDPDRTARPRGQVRGGDRRGRPAARRRGRSGARAAARQGRPPAGCLVRGEPVPEPGDLGLEPRNALLQRRRVCGLGFRLLAEQVPVALALLSRPPLGASD